MVVESIKAASDGHSEKPIWDGTFTDPFMTVTFSKKGLPKTQFNVSIESMNTPAQLDTQVWSSLKISIGSELQFVALHTLSEWMNWEAAVQLLHWCREPFRM